MLVSYVAGEGKEPTVHRQNVVVLEKKEVEQISSCAIYL